MNKSGKIFLFLGVFFISLFLFFSPEIRITYFSVTYFFSDTFFYYFYYLATPLICLYLIIYIEIKAIKIISFCVLLISLIYPFHQLYIGNQFELARQKINFEHDVMEKITSYDIFNSFCYSKNEFPKINNEVENVFVMKIIDNPEMKKLLLFTNRQDLLKGRYLDELSYSLLEDRNNICKNSNVELSYIDLRSEKNNHQLLRCTSKKKTELDYSSRYEMIIGEKINTSIFFGNKKVAEVSVKVLDNLVKQTIYEDKLYFLLNSYRDNSFRHNEKNTCFDPYFKVKNILVEMFPKITKK